MKKWIYIILALGVVAISVGFYSSNRKNKVPKYRFEKVERGDISSTVTATGSLAAVTTVQVGSQVSGIISRIYVDFNTPVSKGQLLAELDPTSFQAVLDQRQADLERVRVEMRNAELVFQRSKNLLANGFVSRSEFDTAEANLNASRAAVEQAQAVVRQARTNLAHTKILSPIEGVVVDRQYDIGQTVAASFQAPTLFTIAQDLSKMRVSTNIDEADIGKIRMAQKATFTVDAFPEKNFEGTITQVRLSPQTVQNVVTYPVLIDVANPELQLKPGMTANVSIPVESRTDMLKVPNSALRFRPPPDDVAGAPNRTESGRRDRDSRGGASVVYLQSEEGKLKPVPVKTSITDGTYTAVESPNLQVGELVATGFVTSRSMESRDFPGSSTRRFR